MTTIYLNHCPSCGKELTDEEKAYSGEHDCVGYLLSGLERVREENRWIPVSERLPESLQPVFAKVKTNGKIFITAAQYVAPKTVLASNFLDDEYREGAEEYDEEIDDYWVVEGWWENSIEADVNWKLSGEVIAWRPLPAAPEEG